jgi:hypothetical protein
LSYHHQSSSSSSSPPPPPSSSPSNIFIVWYSYVNTSSILLSLPIKHFFSVWVHSSCSFSWSLSLSLGLHIDHYLFTTMCLVLWREFCCHPCVPYVDTTLP